MQQITKVTKILILLLLSAAFLAGLWLVKQVQETRKGAYFGQAKAWFLPTADADTVANKKVGDQLPVYLVANFGDIKVAAFTMKLVFSPNVLTLGENDISLNSHFSQPILKHVDANAGVIILSAVVGVNDDGASGSLNTNDPLVKLNFTIKNYGSAEIYLDKDYAYHEFVADTDTADAEIDLKNQNGGDEIKVTYQLNAPECEEADDCEDNNPCTQDVCENNQCQNPALSDGASCGQDKICLNGQCVESKCQPGEKDCGGPGNRPRVCNSDHQWQTEPPCASDEVCQDGECVALEATPTEEPEAGAPVLNFKVTFTGVLNAKAVKTVPEVVVKIKRGFDLIGEYSGIELEPDEGAVFKGRVVLTGLQPGSGYTIYIKGPKHLARKFCQDKQTERCFGEGQISLQQGENNFDFSQLSLEPGDVPNPSENMKQDGLVNSNDFSAIRLRLGQTAPEELRVADLDFNGVVNTRDIVLLLQTLSSKYGEEE